GFDLPAHRFAGAQGHERIAAEYILARHSPIFAHERDRIRIARQAVEVRAEMACEAFEPVERAGVLESLCVEGHRERGGIAAGAAATNSAASRVVTCSSTIRSAGKSRTMRVRCRWTNTRSRSNTSTSGSVTSPCSDKTRSCASIAANAGHARSITVTPASEWVVAPAG